MRTPTKVSVLTLSALSLMIVGASVVSAQTPSNEALPELTQEQREQREQHKQHKANHELAKSAIETNDLAAWLEATQNHPNAEEFATEATFTTLVKAHELREAGDLEAAKTLLEESGIQLGNHGTRGHKFAGSETERQAHKEAHQAIQTAIDNNDFATWQELALERPNGEEFATQETFNTLVKINELKNAGELEAARELGKELGQEFGQKFGFKQFGKAKRGQE